VRELSYIRRYFVTQKASVRGKGRRVEAEGRSGFLRGRPRGRDYIPRLSRGIKQGNQKCCPLWYCRPISLTTSGILIYSVTRHLTARAIPSNPRTKTQGAI